MLGRLQDQGQIGVFQTIHWRFLTGSSPDNPDLLAGSGQACASFEITSQIDGTHATETPPPPLQNRPAVTRLTKHPLRTLSTKRCLNLLVTLSAISRPKLPRVSLRHPCSVAAVWTILRDRKVSLAVECELRNNNLIALTTTATGKSLSHY